MLTGFQYVVIVKTVYSYEKCCPVVYHFLSKSGRGKDAECFRVKLVLKATQGLPFHSYELVFLHDQSQHQTTLSYATLELSSSIPKEIHNTPYSTKIVRDHEIQFKIGREYLQKD